MSVVTEIVTPLIQAGVYIIILGVILYGIYWVVKSICPNARLWFKYKVFRRNYDAQNIDFCVEALEKGIDEVGIKKAMLIHGNSPKEIKEMLYTLIIVKELMKGGKV